jgi:L-ascorbate metabolism protein UlaG (beta-lactamase superfamily)
MEAMVGLSVAIGVSYMLLASCFPHSTAHNLLNRIYISGDTLMVDDLKAIPEHYKGQNIDLMLIHLGGTMLPSPSLPLLMVTMDAKQGLELVKLICPDLTIPIHYE